jgi:hypothetical protein
MFLFFAIIATLQAPAHAGDQEDAAVLLSRFPAGSVPAVPTVMAAITTLSDSGQTEHLPLLRSLMSDETGPVGRAASQAVAHITGESVIADATADAQEPVKVEPAPQTVAIDVR